MSRDSDDKVTWSIGRFADRLDISPHTLRYYEAAGLMTSVPRTSSGHREYHERHAKWVTFLRALRRAGMGVTAIREYVGHLQRGPDGTADRMAMLEDHLQSVDEKLTELQQHRDLLQSKVDAYHRQSILCGDETSD